MLSLLLVDDEYLVRKGLKETVNWSEFDIEIIGEAGNGVEGLEMAVKHKPDIIITDIYMPIMNGLEFITNIRGQGLDAEIVVLSGYAEFAFAKEAMKNGAIAYILRPVDHDELIETIQRVVTHVKRKKSADTYYKSLENELPNLKNHFIDDLFKGHINTIEKFKEKVEFFGLDVYYDQFAVLNIKIAVTNIKEQEEVNILSKIIDSKCSNKERYKCILNGNSNKDITMLMTFPHNAEGILDAIHLLSRTVIEEIKSYSFTASIGISNVSRSLEKINCLYDDAVAASGYMNAQKRSSITHIDDLDSGSDRKIIRAAINIIKNNYQRPLTVESVSGELFISKSHLMHEFKEETGQTFNEYLTNHRIEVAKLLLKDLRYKIYEVGEMVGYPDVKYFSQLFKKVTGYSPSEYSQIP